MSTPYKRDELSKLEGMECFFRGGFEMGYQQALVDIRASIAPVEAHVQELAEWAGGDASIVRDPPVLTLEAAADGG